MIARPDRSGMTLSHLLVLLAIVVAALGFLAPVIQRARERSNLALCRENLRRIGAGLTQYACANQGALPVSPTVENPHVQLVECLANSGCVGDGKNYYCPSQPEPALSFSDGHFKSGTIGYYYYSALAASENPALSKFLRSPLTWPRKLNTSMDARSWVMSDIWVSGQPTVHPGYRKGLNYLMLDGSVDFVGQSPRQAFH